MKASRSFALLLMCFLIASGTQLQADTDIRPRAQAIELAIEPEFDGVVAGDPAWVDVTPISNFTQQLPNHGEPASMATEVFVGYTDEALHIAFIAYEDDINDMNPSSNGWQSDSILAVIDPYQNRLTGYGFSTNQTGVEWDTSVYNSRSDWNWSTVWQVKSSVNEDNWSCELVIPFTSLDYPAQAVQNWGFNFARVIKGRNEVAHWSPIPRQFSVWRFEHNGTIENIKPPPAKRNVKVNPYAISSRGEGRDADLNDRSDVGFDILYSLSPTLNLTATYNTDFAQVESDQLQINTGRFSLFFPETRPFFLENGPLFNVGVPRETLVFHSRRIGVARDGRRLPMDGGVKLAGHLGRKNEIGLMHLRADREFAQGTEDFTIARYSRQFANRSKFGFLGTHRDSGSHSSQAFSTDLQWAIGEYAEIRSFAATSQSSDGMEREDEYAYSVYGNYNRPDWQGSASYHEVGSGFNPTVGYVQRRNSRKSHVAFRHSRQMHGKWGLNEWQPNGIYTAYWDFDGYKESGYLLLENYVIWKNGANFWTDFNLVEEGVRYPFFIAGEEVLVGEYRSPQLSIGMNSPQDRSWGIGGAFTTGEFYQGDAMGLGVWANYTHSEYFNTFLNYNRNDIDFPNLDAPFTFSLIQLGARASFTPKISLAALLQYNEADDVISANIRFAWLRTANTGFYLVFNEINEQSIAGESVRRFFVLKYSHMFDVNF